MLCFSFSFVNKKWQKGKKERKKEMYLVCDLPSVVFQGELWQWHLWPGI